MKITIVCVLAILFVVPFAMADDDIYKHLNTSPTGLLSEEIDPDFHAYGMPWHSSEEDIINAWGQPTGYIRFNSQETGMVYGHSHLFVFCDGKLAGLTIKDDIFVWQASQYITPHHIFDRVQWRLKNGITDNLDIKEIDKLVDAFPLEDTYKDSSKFYTTDKAKVIITYTSRITKNIDTNKVTVSSIVDGIVIEVK